jgi:hypothetical protein
VRSGNDHHRRISLARSSKAVTSALVSRGVCGDHQTPRTHIPVQPPLQPQRGIQ